MTYIPALRNVESTSNSTSTPLGSNGVYTGTIEDILYFTQIELCIFSDVSSALSGIVLQFSDVNNVTNFNNPTTSGSLYVKESLTGGSYFYKKYETLARYFRIVFTNGATAQSVFRLKTILSADQKRSEVTRGFNPVVRIPSDNIIDMFGRTRSSDPYTLFESKLLTTSDLKNWSRVNTTGQAEGSTFVYNIQQPYLKLNMASGSTGKIISQSRKYVPYVPGKSTLVLVTGTLVTRSGSTASGAVSRIGFFDDKTEKTNGSEIPTGDGWFFQCTDSTNGTGNDFTLAIVERSSIDDVNPATPAQTDSVIAQANWNNDPLNGSGPSGYIFDPRQKAIFFFNFEWLGVGISSVGVVAGGRFITCHVFTHFGTGALPYNTRPSLPVRYEISRASTVAVPVNLTRVCSTVISEGGFNPIGYPFSISSRASGKTSTTITPGTEYTILAIRLKSTRPRVTVNIQSCDIMTVAQTNAVGIYNLKLYRIFTTTSTPPVTGGAWVSVDSDSAIEYNITPTAYSLSGVNYNLVYEVNYTVTKQAATTANQFLNRLECTSDIAGYSDYYVLTTTTVVNANNGDVSYGFLSWFEYE